MKLWRACFVCLFLSFALLAGAAVSVRQQQTHLADRLIRLHVVAASDSVSDQAVKLKVRDALLSVLDDGEWENRADAASWMEDRLPELERSAVEALRRSGDPNGVTVTLTREYYPTRRYDTFSLPAGEYLSLRAVIGKGEGHNWWCVVYPAMCMASSADDMEAKAVSAGFTDADFGLITGNTPEIRIRFRLLELLAAAGKLLRRLG